VIAIRIIIPVNNSIIDIPDTSNSKGLAVINSVDTADTADTQIDSDSITLSTNRADKNIHTTPDMITAKDTGNTPEQITKGERVKVSDSTNNLELFFSVLNTLAAIWIIGVILFLLYHFVAYLNYRKKISRWSLRVNKDEVLEQYRGLCVELNIKRQLNISTCKQVQTPLLIGFIKPCIVLPDQNFTAEQYYFILKHELIHYKHRDLFYKLILLFAAALHWFNPFIHFMVYLANHDMELYCDEQLVADNNLIYRENYSKMLLKIITEANKNNNVLLTTGFGSKSKRLKTRFYQIMNSKPTKKGRGLIIALVCLILIVGNLIAWFMPAKSSNAEISDKRIAPSASSAENKSYTEPDLSEEVSNVLVVGIDGRNNDDNLRADSILVVSINPGTKKISLVSFLRDMYLEIPEHGKNKLSLVYNLGGANLIESTIETNFDILIDHTVVVNMEAFENIIDSIGGLDIELSEEEAKYLNNTNYISNKKYRNVIAGKQRLNGNQVLGYVRVRMVPTLQGENGDLGRTARLRSVLSSVIEENRKKELSELTEVITNVIPSVSSDLSLSQMINYMNTVLQGDLDTATLSIPVEDSYTTKVQDGMSVMEVDLDKNIKILKQIHN
jgi:LCP family protein required for cell wall assembly